MSLYNDLMEMLARDRRRHNWEWVMPLTQWELLRNARFSDDAPAPWTGAKVIQPSVTAAAGTILGHAVIIDNNAAWLGLVLRPG